MKYALVFSVVCLIVVLTHQQCSIYQNSGIRGLDKVGERDNICGYLLSKNDLDLTDFKIDLKGSSEITESESIDICSIKLDEEMFAICKVAMSFKQSILDKEEEDLTIISIGDHEYTYYLDDLEDTKIYMYISQSDIAEFNVDKSKGLICTKKAEEEEEDLESTTFFLIATKILENVWHDIKSQEKDKNNP